MTKQHKRGSLLDNGEHAAQSSKKPRGPASPTAVVERELPEEKRRRARGRSWPRGCGGDGSHGGAAAQQFENGTHLVPLPSLPASPQTSDVQGESALITDLFVGCKQILICSNLSVVSVKQNV